MADVRDLLTDESLKGREMFGQFDSVDALAKAHLNLTDLHRNGPPRLPKADADASDWEKFWGNTRPQDKAVYGLEDPIAEKVYEAGLHPTQVNKLKDLLTTPKEPKNPSEEWKKAAQERFGERLDEVLGVARKAVGRLEEQIPGLRKTLDETGFGNHPDIIALMGQIGRTMTSDSAPDDAGMGGDANPNMARQYRLEIAQLMLNPEFENQRSPEGLKLRAQVQELDGKLRGLGYDGIHDPRLA